MYFNEERLVNCWGVILNLKILSFKLSQKLIGFCCITCAGAATWFMQRGRRNSAAKKGLQQITYVLGEVGCVTFKYMCF